jgi:hypothetical protein
VRVHRSHGGHGWEHRWGHSHLAPLSAVSYLPSFAVQATANLLSAVTRGQQYAQGACTALHPLLASERQRRGYVWSCRPDNANKTREIVV